ncbi:Uncharacterised protein [Streptococcus pneumoniae]|jgi:hypothetical protein|nr:hypothetical protein [Streptococcus pneumoniae]CAG5861238.1 Uncharacterised protein [Streptococcus pneumoniae]CAG6038042.1 Uncharacterised protein [Streptococcus pneumoniae]CAG6081659.1 Uncharacterised protein [Streptococcus pneumoniae]CAG6083219.1 Uncharacterised protein [Streptococcus pneumoniae]CAG6190040.1 Uncharacterised protein [Streptococcus pneumoniae]
MKVNEYFWKTTSLTLLLIMSFFAGFGAKLEFTSYNPFLSVKFGLVVALIVFVVQLLAILPAMIRGNKNENVKSNNSCEE